MSLKRVKCKCCGEMMVTYDEPPFYCDACNGIHNYAKPDKGLSYLIRDESASPVSLQNQFDGLPIL